MPLSLESAARPLLGLQQRLAWLGVVSVETGKPVEVTLDEEEVVLEVEVVYLEDLTITTVATYSLGSSVEPYFGVVCG